VAQVKKKKVAGASYAESRKVTGSTKRKPDIFFSPTQDKHSVTERKLGTTAVS